VDPDDARLVRSVCHDVELIPLELANLSRAVDYVGRLRSLFSRLPYAVARFGSRAMRDTFRRRLASAPPDAVVCDVFSAANITDMSIPLVVNNENVEHVIIHRYMLRARHPLKVAYAWLECRKMKRWERHVCSHSLAGMACSRADRHLLKTLCPSLPVEVVPNVFDISGAPIDMPEEPAWILFQGGMDWYPNRDAVSFFVSDILPILRQRVPEVTFVVAGRDPEGWLASRFRHTPGVLFLPAADAHQMRPIVARAAVCVVPLRIGSGTRFKILEAASLARPIVSTNVGAEGLDFADGSELILADDPVSFARAVERLLLKPGERRALGQAAQRRVESSYSFAVLTRSVAAALEHVENGASPGALRDRTQRTLLRGDRP
jgi:hypothetical protein